MSRITKEQELFLMVMTVAMEAEGESYRGKLAVAHVIMNRAYQKNRNIIAVVFKPYAFSAWNTRGGRQRQIPGIADMIWDEAEKAAISAYYEIEPDPTYGATHYLNIPLTRRIRGGTLPKWVNKLKKTAVIGQHTFLIER